MPYTMPEASVISLDEKGMRHAAAALVTVFKVSVILTPTGSAVISPCS